MAKNRRPRGGSKTQEPRNKTDHNDSGAKALERGLADIREELTSIKTRVEELDGEDVSDLRSEVTGLKDSLDEVATKAADILAKNDTQADLVEGFKARIDAIDVALQAPGAGKREVPKTMGEQIFESEGYKAFIKDPKNVKKFAHEIADALDGPASMAAILGSGSKAAPVLGSAELGALDYSARRQAIVSPALESVDAFMPLIPIVPTPGTELYDYRKETTASVTGFLRTTLKTALTGATTAVDTCTVNDSTHLLVGTFLRFFDSDGDLLGRLQIKTNNTATGVLEFEGTNPIDWDMDAGDNLTAEQWGSTDESEAKGYSYLAAEAVQVVLKTIALNIATTRQRLNSAAGLDAWIRRVLPMRWRRNVAWQLLYGDATAAGAPQLAGFATESGVQTYAWSSGTVGDNRADAILRAVLLVVGDNITIVMNKRDRQALRLMKDTAGDYLISPNFGKIAIEKIGRQWFLDGYPIIESDAVVDGDFFLIDFAEASEMPDQGSSSLEFGLINDQFIRNELTVRYEATVAHAILDTTRYVYGTWDAAPS